MLHLQCAIAEINKSPKCIIMIKIFEYGQLKPQACLYNIVASMRPFQNECQSCDFTYPPLPTPSPPKLATLKTSGDENHLCGASLHKSLIP